MFLEAGERSDLNDVGADASHVVTYAREPVPLLPVPQATTWELIGVSGNKPSARFGHVAAWSEAANGLYLHGGDDGSSAGAQEVGRGGDWRL